MGRRQFPQEQDDGAGNAIHGFVHRRPWRVVHSSASRAVGQFQASVDDPEILNWWPADFCLTAEYELTADSLVCQLQVENPGDTPLPCGLGLHPYFRTSPAESNEEHWHVQVPVTHQWELNQKLPTGRQLALGEFDRLAHGMRLSDMQLDHIFGGIQFRDRVATATIRDLSRDLALRIEFDNTNYACVVYNPPHRQAVCIEPYTCVPDAARLSAMGIESGLKILAGGDTLTTRMAIRVDHCSGT